MRAQLTQKEQTLLRDQMTHEKVCIDKYNSYSQRASDPQLKQLFSSYASQEQQHYDTISNMLGQSGTMTQGQPQQQTQQGSAQPSGLQGRATQFAMETGEMGATSQDDAMLCSDMLMTEKFVSGAYDTAIFESANPSLRQSLQHIQKEEQQHGEGIFNYMNQRGMYNPK